MQVVAVGVGLACKHLCYHHMLQTAFYTFHFFHILYLESAECQQIVQFMRGQFSVYIFPQPFI